MAVGSLYTVIYDDGFEGGDGDGTGIAVIGAWREVFVAIGVLATTL